MTGMTCLTETMAERIRRAVGEDVALMPYHPEWPGMFEAEKQHLLVCLPNELIRRIEHFGSTSVPGLAAKPIVDMLVQVTDLEKTRTRIVPVLESQGYDYFWRPSLFDEPPFYAWFIKRNGAGLRTHHIHMVEAHFEHWDRLLFRDYLMEHPDAAAEYQTLKFKLSRMFPNDRVGYTKGKTEFITKIMEIIKRNYIESG
jgi:GrpB-like predicted nucleotidyltransferase (UPF0157 family)